MRSPRGKGKESGALHQVHPQRILAQVLNALQQRNGFDTREVDDVVMGCGAGSGDHSMDIARMAALDAGWSIEAPGVTLNRFCGSGQQAVNFAAMGVLSGFQDLVVAGGVESMSRPAPMHVDGFTANNRHLRDQYDMVPQGISADLIATTGEFTRAVRPARRRQPEPRPGRDRRGPLRQVAGADLPRRRFWRSTTRFRARAPPWPTSPSWRRASPVWARCCPTVARASTRSPASPIPTSSAIEHVHHAGNSSGVVDGSRRGARHVARSPKAHGMTPRARIVMTAVAGTGP
ncbi:MAG: hypothetical protein R2713_00115 [Ilumatobacteraceae bacterium]